MHYVHLPVLNVLILIQTVLNVLILKIDKHSHLVNVTKDILKTLKINVKFVNIHAKNVMEML